MSDAAVAEILEEMPVIVPNNRRFIDAKEAQISLEEGEKGRSLRGYAAVFNRKSLTMLDFFEGPFREQIAPGAFKRSLANSDIVALWQHRDEWPLARTSAGNLTLREDDRGLHTEIELGETSWAQDAYHAIKSGIVRNMSFGFQPLKWEDDRSTKPFTRTLTEVRLLEVSPVTFPAYPDTTIGARALLTTSGLDVDALSRVLVRARRGDALRRYEHNLIDEFYSLLTTLRAASDPADSHSEDDEASPDPADSHSEQTSVEQEAAPARAAPRPVDPATAARLRARLAALPSL